MAKSPSVTLIERDASAYTTTTSTSVLAIVGYATKGPIEEVTLVTSRSNFLEKFGPPPTTSPYSSLAAYRAFNQTNGLLFVRVANTSGDTYTAVKAEKVINLTTSGDTVSGDSIRKKVLLQMNDYGSANNGSYVIVSSRTNPLTGDTLWDMAFYYDEKLKENYQEVSWNNGDTNFFETVINRDPDNGGSEWFSVDTYSKKGDSNFIIPAGTYYIGTSQTGDTTAWATGDSWTELVSKRYDYRPGTDGIPTEGGDSLFTEVLSTSGGLANTELWNFHILITPDTSSEAVENAAIALAEYRKDFMYLADPPYGKSVANVVNWHNGGDSQGRSTAINSSYTATYWPWLKDYNSVAGEYVWCPPSVFLAEKYLEIDKNFGPWYACAGDNRGKIAAFDYEYSPSFAERETMYGDLNAVNPIVNFASKGLEVYGQKTLLRENSALNRVNVRRMVIYVKKLIKTAMDAMVFEPHTPDSWARATNSINSILEPVRQANGLSDYRVTIDGTTNTPDLIQQSIMSGIIQLVPVGTIEIIELTIQVNASGTTIS